jgi:hypothetical protein
MLRSLATNQTSFLNSIEVRYVLEQFLPSNVDNVIELSGIYTGRILKGEKPADMPVGRPSSS